MPDPSDPALQRAVDAAVSAGRPDFGSVYARSRRHHPFRWAGLGMGLTAAAALTVVLSLPPAPPAFDRQVEAFVALVWSE